MLFRSFTCVVILAAYFDLLEGRVEVTVPWVQSRSDYAVAREYPLVFAGDCMSADGALLRQCSVTPATSARSSPSSGGAEQGAQEVFALYVLRES